MDEIHKFTSTPGDVSNLHSSTLFNISAENDSGYLTHTPSLQSKSTYNTSEDVSVRSEKSVNATLSLEKSANAPLSLEKSANAPLSLEKSANALLSLEKSSGKLSVPSVSPVSSDGMTNKLKNRFREPSFEGRRYVDFMYHLSHKRNHSLITKHILSYLKPQDLYNMMRVSKAWRNAILSSPSSDRKVRRYRNKLMASKENHGQANREEVTKYGIPGASRIKLSQIQNIQLNSGSSRASSSASPPISPSKYRFHMFQKEGKKLERGQRLFSCPRCSFPGHIDSKEVNLAQCTNPACMYKFCTLCSFKEHAPKPCNFISTPVVRKNSASVGTLKSKKNLKRLLL